MTVGVHGGGGLTTTGVGNRRSREKLFFFTCILVG